MAKSTAGRAVGDTEGRWGQGAVGDREPLGTGQMSRLQSSIVLVLVVVHVLDREPFPCMNRRV
jgi:hypothetical protein